MIRGKIIADIGSDHAYLPIWLYVNKKTEKSYALDISPKCVDKIKFNLKRYNIPEDIILPVLSDGLLYFEENNCFHELTDIIIAGMGGENIAEIISKINIKNIKDINFILQPNSKVEFLREFLYKNKFNIVQETIAEDDETGKTRLRLYNIINAKFTDNDTEYNPELVKPIEIVAGKDINHAGYINKIIKRLKNIIADLDKKGGEKYSIKTEFGYYKDIENLITELELKKVRKS